MISKADHLEFWKRSVAKAAEIEDFYAKKKKKKKKLTPYKLKEQVYDWVTEENFGVTHYGCSPKEFLLSEVWVIFFIWTVQYQKV